MSWFKKPQVSVGVIVCVVAAVIFWLAAVGWAQGRLPTEMARWVLEYLGIDASWTTSVGGWIEEREDFVLSASTVILFGGVLAVSGSDSHLAGGPAPGAFTALAAFAFGLEAGAGLFGLLFFAAIGFAFGLIGALTKDISPKEAGIGTLVELLIAAVTPALFLMVFFVRSQRSRPADDHRS